MLPLDSKLYLPKGITLAILLAITPSSYAFDFMQGQKVLQLGGYLSHSGKTQFIGIEDLIGDRFTVSKHHDGNLLVGLGYLFNHPLKETAQLSYGMNVFYLAKTYVKGQVIQEDLFENLAYKYGLTHLPIYAAAKASINNPANSYGITFDSGIGLNILTTSSFHEKSLDGITLPDHAFSGHSQAAFSAMAGFGLKINNVFGHAPLECGYRFFI
ncbi:hypothetical protein [Legionella tunisiensis]|uniref:hypothetical protein n=1 Tax=Legionella tunisiensis TaxID=1034944 RepID=UPI0002E18ED5|nr:hypothetical protein [Legionella tunisiensis]